MKRMHVHEKKDPVGKVRVAYLVTHPIQYQVPLFRRIAQDPEFELRVFFRSDFSTRAFVDGGFGRQIKWDTNLLEGYRYEVLPAFGPTDKFSFFKPWNFGLRQRLKRGGFDILWIHGYAHMYHLYAMIAAKSLGMKNVDVFIRDEATIVSKKRSMIKQAAKKVFFKCLNFLCDGFLAIGTMNQEYYLAHGIPGKKIFQVPYAVDNKFFQEKASQCRPLREKLRRSLGLLPERPVILYASKLTDRKRSTDLLEAYNLASRILDPKPYLLFVGDGKLRSSLTQKVKELQLEMDVIFLGFKNQSELPCFYDLCDVFVLPSVFEPWGLVINEAMNCGCAVIASDHVGSARDLIHPGKNGFVFKAGNVQELVEALIETLSNLEGCRDMGFAGLDIISRWGFDEDIKGLKRAANAIIQ